MDKDMKRVINNQKHIVDSIPGYYKSLTAPFREKAMLKLALSKKSRTKEHVYQMDENE